MKRFVVPALLVLGSLVAFVRIEERLRCYESRPQADPVLLSALDRELVKLRAELAQARSELRAELKDDVGARLAQVEGVLANAESELAWQAEQLATLHGLDADEINGCLFDVRSSLEDNRRTIRELLESTQETARIANASAPRRRDKNQMWHELVGPIVQLTGGSTVGSGVLLSPDTAQGETCIGYVLTAWHVVRDIVAEPQGDEGAVPLKIYQPGGEIENETATLLIRDVDLDVALLRINSSRCFDQAARTASVQRLREIAVFDSVYAVGCPLGNDPIPTYGEIASTQHSVDGCSYWMISAPTYIGNSGGGIFDAQTHELLGIFSKIYTHGSLRATIVPHMGLVTPLDAIYTWLDREGYTILYEIPAPEGQEEPDPSATASPR